MRVLGPTSLPRAVYRKAIRPFGIQILTGPLSSRLVSRSDLTNTGSSTQELFFEYSDVERIEREKPRGKERVHPALRSEVGTETKPKPFVRELSNVELIGRWGLTITEENRYVVEEAEGSVRRLVDTITQTSIDGQVPLYRGVENEVSRPLVSMVGRFSTEYFHWFSDYLPRLIGVEEYERRTGRKPELLIPDETPQWLQQSLRWVGPSAARWRTWEGGRKHVDTLVTPSLRKTGYDDTCEGWGFVSPTALRWVRERMMDGAKAEHASTERIYISRADADLRQVTNESAVMSYLSEKGFERYLLSEMTIEEQVKLFASAELVVAPHGAGLINMIYGDDISVVELFGDNVHPCYYAIAAGFDFDYRYLLCEQVEQSMRVDLEKLDEVVSDAISSLG